MDHDTEEELPSMPVRLLKKKTIYHVNHKLKVCQWNAPTEDWMFQRPKKTDDRPRRRESFQVPRHVQAFRVLNDVKTWGTEKEDVQDSYYLNFLTKKTYPDECSATFDDK